MVFHDGNQNQLDEVVTFSEPAGPKNAPPIQKTDVSRFDETFTICAAGRVPLLPEFIAARPLPPVLTHTCVVVISVLELN